MTVEVRCISCSRVIMGYPEGDKLPTEKEIVDCPHCGTANRVRPIKAEPKPAPVKPEWNKKHK
jgi:DNA-directed RNA polymerase subunit RPC12/RpoP